MIAPLILPERHEAGVHGGARHVLVVDDVRGHGVQLQLRGGLAGHLHTGAGGNSPQDSKLILRYKTSAGSLRHSAMSSTQKSLSPGGMLR